MNHTSPLRAIGRGLLCACLCLATGQVGSQTATTAAPPMPPPGRMVDVGGWRLHLHCTGTARPKQPTVVLEAGLGAFSVEWSLVQPLVADFARVCSYDRAGSGWSEWGPHPRTMRQVVYELHTLLKQSGEAGPFVLVGASYGGWIVRLYQVTYSSEVAGLILVDAGSTDPLRLMPDGRAVRSSELNRGRPVPEVKKSGPLREADIPPAALEQIRSGLPSASAKANEPPRDKLPVEAQQMRAWGLGQVGHVVAAVNPFEAEELAELRRATTDREYPLGQLPLIVLTRGRLDEEGPEAQAREREHRSDQERQARMSRSARLVVADNCGHHIQLERPELVVSIIREMLAELRGPAPAH